MKNRYTQDKAASAEILRLLLQKMAAHPAAFTPFAYALWYEYITGINPPLSKAVNALLDNKQQLTDDLVQELYANHIADGNVEAEQAFKQNMQKVLENLARFTEATDDEAGKFNAGLRKHGERLSSGLDAESLQGLVGEIAQETQVMRSSVDSLQDKLQESKSEVERLQLELMSARSEALLDPLTGVFNRRGFEAQMRNLSANPEMQGKQVSFLMLDIDFFKKINDTYGHLFGDKVIRVIAEVLKAQVKGQDSVARLGGEEFAVILPDTPLQGAKVVAEHVRQLVERGKIRRMDKDESVGGITISLGIAVCDVGADWLATLGQADEALYASKQGGRNRSTIYAPPQG
ncbi:MAG TPA: diguanylate cyclase [Gallionella sp.]|nr:diguanylate cyclase [Gallionella sp.]